MPSEQTAEGIILRSLDYKERQKILTIFTKDQGLISLIVKGVTKTKPHLLSLTTPLTQATFHFQIKRSTLYTFQDATLLNTHLFLRERLETIQAASEMAKALYKTQLPEKPAPKLYDLFLFSLTTLPQFVDPAPLVQSFRLKLLKHEGLLHLAPECAHCQEPSTHLSEGSTVCKNHLTHSSTPLSQQTFQTLYTLANTRSLAKLQDTPISPIIEKLITQLFALDPSFQAV